MQPRIWIHKGFVMIDPADNYTLYNKLTTSKFLTKHPKSATIYYCMVNNFGLKFLKDYEKFFRNNFELNKDIEDLLSQKEVEYVGKRNPKLLPTTLKGITYEKHQTKALELIGQYKQFCIFLGPGTGKTLISIDTIDMIKEPGLYIIVTPKKALGQYLGEVMKYIPYASAFIIGKDVDHGTGIRVGIINYESVHRLSSKTTYKALILDESHKCKNSMSLTNKIICKLNAENTYLMSGTPQDKMRNEVFAQLKILNKDLMGVKYLFEERFFYLDDYGNPKKEKRPAELEEIIEKVTYGDKTENLLTLPKEEDMIIDCVMTSDVSKIYKEFESKKVIKGNGWYALGDSSSKHRSKLTQLCSGFVYDEEDNPRRLKHNPKEEGLLFALSKCPKAIIFFCYTEEMHIISDILTREKKSFGCVSGKTKDNDTTTMNFKKGLIDYLVIQIKSGNAALDFPMINNVIYYSLHDSYIFFDQSHYRIRRIGQTNVCYYYYLLVKGSVEKGRFRSVKNKKNFNDKEYEIYRRRNQDE